MAHVIKLSYLLKDSFDVGEFEEFLIWLLFLKAAKQDKKYF